MQVAQSLPSALHWLPLQFVVVCVGQVPLPSHIDLFVRTPFEQLCAAQAVVLSNVQVCLFDLSQMPAHSLDPPQAFRGVEVKLQVPVAQDSQFPPHMPSQQ